MIVYRLRDASGELYYFTARSITFAAYVGTVEPNRLLNLPSGGTLAAKDVPAAFLRYDDDGALLLDQTWARFRSGGVTV